MVSSTPRPHFSPGKDPVPIVQEAGWGPGPVWTGEENLVPNGILSRTAQPVAQSLYRLSYPAHHWYLMSRLRMSGAMPIRPLYALILYTGITTSLPLFFLKISSPLCNVKIAMNHLSSVNTNSLILMLITHINGTGVSQSV